MKNTNPKSIKNICYLMPEITRRIEDMVHIFKINTNSNELEVERLITNAKNIIRENRHQNDSDAIAKHVSPGGYLINDKLPAEISPGVSGMFLGCLMDENGKQQKARLRFLK